MTWYYINDIKSILLYYINWHTISMVLSYMWFIEAHLLINQSAFGNKIREIKINHPIGKGGGDIYGFQTSWYLAANRCKRWYHDMTSQCNVMTWRGVGLRILSQHPRRDIRMYPFQEILQDLLTDNKIIVDLLGIYQYAQRYPMLALAYPSNNVPLSFHSK